MYQFSLPSLQMQSAASFSKDGRMLLRISTNCRAWILRHLYRETARLRQQQWIGPYMILYGMYTDLVFLKPRYFTDKTSLHNFVVAASNEKIFGSKCQVIIYMASGQEVSGANAVDEYANAAPEERTQLQIAFRGEDQSVLITFSAKTDKWRASTTITGEETLYTTIADICARYTKPMGFLRRHRSAPLVEPINSKEESDRRNRWETNWKNILVSAMTGLLAGLLPLVLKAILHI